MEKIVKNKWNIIILSIVAILLIGFTTVNLLSNKTYKEINYTEFKKIIKSNKKEVIFVGSATCSHCTMFKPTLNKVIKQYNIKVYYIDLDKLNEEEYNKVKEVVKFNGTPTTVVLKNGKIFDKETTIEGDQKRSVIIEKFKLAGIIK